MFSDGRLSLVLGVVVRQTLRIGGRSYRLWLKRADEANTRVPFFSGSSRDGTTTPSVMSK